MFNNYASDERVAKFMPWTAYERKEDALSFLQMMIAEYEKTDCYHWAIEYDGWMSEYYLRHDGTYSDAMVYGIVRHSINTKQNN